MIDWEGELAHHGKELRGLIRKKLAGAGESAEDDIFQEVSIAAHSQAVGEVEPERVKAWLNKVAIYKVKDYWRKVERKATLDGQYARDGELTGGGGDSPYEWVMALERSELVVEALGRLAEEERVALTRKYLGGQTCGEIARSEGLSEKMIEYRLKKAREGLRKVLVKFL